MFDDPIRYHAQVRPDAAAVIGAEARLSFVQLDAAVDRAAAALVALDGFDPAAGEAVAVGLADAFVEWLLVLALARLGIASAQQGDDACRMSIGDGMQATLPLSQAWIEDMLSGPAVPPVRRARDPAAPGRVLRSSGTTGQARRIGLSFAAIDAAVRNVPVTYGPAEGAWLAATGIDTILGFTVPLAAWATGNAVVIDEAGFDADAVARHRPRLVAMVPGQLRQLVDDWGGPPPDFPLRLVVAGGAVPPALAREGAARLTPDLSNLYGASETGGVASAPLAMILARPGAAGALMPGVVVQVVDEAGLPVPPGAVGEVRIRGPRGVAGYLDDEVATARAFRDGWFHPGDLGAIGADGVLTLAGRSDDVMNIGGHKILPDHVEALARLYPGVADVAAFGVSGSDGLERCWLAIVPGEGFAEAALAEAMAPLLEPLGQVRWLALDALPRTATGKVRRTALREMAAGLD